MNTNNETDTAVQVFRYLGQRFEYRQCRAEDVPDSVRFDVPRQFQGQAVERAFGTRSAGEADIGDPYLRVTEAGHDIRWYRRSSRRRKTTSTSNDLIYCTEAFYSDGHSSICDDGIEDIGEARSRARALYSDPDVTSVRVLDQHGAEHWGNARD